MSRIVKASLLLFFFSLCGVAFFVAHRIDERRPVPAPRELFAVVNDQLTAFRASDFPGAYRRAASGVQQKFTLPQFELMVRRNYATMLHAHRVEFGSVHVEHGSAVVQVFFFGDGESVRSFLYNLTAEGNAWKIESVEELRPYESTAPLAGSHA